MGAPCPTSPTNVANGAGITLMLGASRQAGVGPLAVFFDATATTAASAPTLAEAFHEIQYVWQFGDPGSGNWSRGSTLGSRNVAAGPVAAHLFEPIAGTGTQEFDVTLTATADGTSTVSYTCKIAVTDPNAVFAGNNTICLSQAGDFTGIPASGCLQVQASADFAAEIAAHAAPGKRLLFRRGEIWIVTGSAVVSVNGPGIIGSFGPGVDPLVKPAALINYPMIRFTGPTSGAVSPVSDWRLMDLRFDGSGLDDQTFSRGVRGSGGGANEITLLRLDIQRVGTALQFFAGHLVAGGQTFKNLAIVDTTVQNTLDTGAFLFAENLMFLGNSLTDVIPLPVGDGHNIRFGYIGKGVVSNNTLGRPTAGRSVIKLVAPNFINPGGSGFVTIAPGTYTEQVVVSDNRLSNLSNSWMFELQPQSTNNDERIRNVIVERNFMLASPNTDLLMTISAHEATIRNNIGNLTGGPGHIGFTVGQFGNCAPECEPPPQNVRIYNNSFFSSDTCCSHTFVEIRSDAAATIEVKNNVAYAPNVSPDTPRMLVDASAPGVVVASNNTTNFTAAPAPPFDTKDSPNYEGPMTVTTGYRLNAGSYARDAGTPVPVFTDFFGNPRTQGAAIDIGATEQ